VETRDDGQPGLAHAMICTLHNSQPRHAREAPNRCQGLNLQRVLYVATSAVAECSVGSFCELWSSVTATAPAAAGWLCAPHLACLAAVLAAHKCSTAQQWSPVTAQQGFEQQHLTWHAWLAACCHAGSACTLRQHSAESYTWHICSTTPHTPQGSIATVITTCCAVPSCAPDTVHAHKSHKSASRCVHVHVGCCHCLHVFFMLQHYYKCRVGS
jgi:hypothetical protein